MARIRINLSPHEELDNPRWWIPDVLTVVLLFAGATLGWEYRVEMINEDIANYQAEQSDFKAKSVALEAKLTEYNEKKKRVEELEHMYLSLSRITESKLTRYLPIILVEHIQNLMPVGVWLEQLDLGKDANSQAQTQTTNSPSPPTADNPNLKFHRTIRLKGGALDNILVAEFMTQLEATAAGEIDESDLRTQVFFRETKLGITKIAQRIVPPQTPAEATQTHPIVEFYLEITFDEHAKLSNTHLNGTSFLNRLQRKDVAQPQIQPNEAQWKKF